MIEKFAEKHNIKIYTNNSEFPDYCATHAIENESILNENELFSSEMLENRNQSYEIDAYLGTTKYVFFALGKGYLKPKNSLGLIYDPFILAKKPGANIVINDLLHVLSETDILPAFCNENLAVILTILEAHYDELDIRKSKDEIIELFTQYLSEGSNLLIGDTQEEIIFGKSFEIILKHLPNKERNYDVS